MSIARAISFELSQETGEIVEGDGWVSKWGIDSRSHKELSLDQVRNMQPDQAGAIYAGPEYWGAIRGDELPDYVSIPMLDSCVNQGPSIAIKSLQEALYVPVDGIIGPQTLRAAHAATNHNQVLAYFTAARIGHYQQDKEWPQAGKGWVRRAVRASLEAVQ